MLDFYQLLKVPSGAKQVDIDRAYQKLIKEAQYDRTLNRKEIERAYRTLSDATQRALYDATAAAKAKQVAANAKASRQVKSASRMQRMVVALVVLLLVFTGYYAFRFGYHLKSFETGDRLYFKDTGRYLGKIKQQEENHSFGGSRAQAFLIVTDAQIEIWLPAGDVKSLCDKR